MAAQSTLAAPFSAPQHTAQPKHTTLCSRQPWQPVERHHADAAVPRVGCNQRLQCRLLHLHADSAAAPTPSSTQGGTQGLQGLPREGWAQAGLLAPVLTRVNLPACPELLGPVSPPQGQLADTSPQEDQCTPVPRRVPSGQGYLAAPSLYSLVSQTLKAADPWRTSWRWRFLTLRGMLDNLSTSGDSDADGQRPHFEKHSSKVANPAVHWEGVRPEGWERNWPFFWKLLLFPP